MTNQKLIEQVSIFLLKKGFTLKSLTRTCFDILARKGSQILLIKVLTDANSIAEEYADGMKKLSSYIKASPLVIAEKAGNELENNVVYSRLGIFTLNFETFKNSVENKFPFIKKTQAGLTASVSGERLKGLREKLGYSLSTLSKKIGVSPRMISKYENSGAEITVQKAYKMYDVFGGNVFKRIDVFSEKKEVFSEPKSPITKKYDQLGFETSETKKVPFDIIAKKEKEIILTEVGDKVNPQMHSLSRLIDADNLVIFKKKKPKDIPAMTKKEFLDFEKANELIKFLKEF